MTFEELAKIAERLNDENADSEKINYAFFVHEEGTNKSAISASGNMSSIMAMISILLCNHPDSKEYVEKLQKLMEDPSLVEGCTKFGNLEEKMN